MLRKNDISEDLLQVLRKQFSARNKNSKQATSEQMLENDTKLTVYVKEVFKNSG